MASIKTSSLIVSTRQKGNPLLKSIRNVTWEYGDIVADYQMSETGCALFLSLRYHAFNPEYVYERLKQLGHSYMLRVLLVQVDVKEPHHAIKELSKIAIKADCSLLLAWSAEDAARYIETYKAYEHKPPDLIMEKVDKDYNGRVQDVLTAVKKVNRTDAITLISNFGSIAGVIKASQDDLELCPGLGPQKAMKLHTAFNQPFIKPPRIKKAVQSAQAKTTTEQAKTSTEQAKTTMEQSKTTTEQSKTTKINAISSYDIMNQ